jgi:hypothetical protein
MIRYRSISVLLLFFFPSILFGQFSLDEFLSQAKNDVRLHEYNLKSKFLGKNPYRSPWIQRTEMRIRTNDLNVSADDYRFRIAPTNPFEIRENRKYYEMEFDFLFTEYQRALNAALNERYRLILDLFENHHLELQKQRQIDLISDELRSLDALTNDIDFSLTDYIEARENLIQTRLEMNEIDHRIGLAELEIRSKYAFSGDIVPVDIDLVEIQTIKKWVNTLFSDVDTMENILVKGLYQENLLSEQRIKLESAEDRRNIGFIQAEYDRDRGNETDEHLGFQLGIRIPLTNPDRPDMNRDKMDLLEDQAGLVERKSEITLQVQLLRLRLDYLFTQYELIITAIAENDFPGMIALSPVLSPEDLIKAQKAVLRMERLEAEIKWEIYRSYIDFLYYSGRLVELPLKNYLSGNLSEI